jgi:hypothetical protein
MRSPPDVRAPVQSEAKDGSRASETQRIAVIPGDRRARDRELHRSGADWRLDAEAGRAMAFGHDDMT